MATTQRLGIWWQVTLWDTVIEEYSTWEAYPYTGVGSTHEFIGGRFDLNIGTYRIDVVLYMNPDNPQIVDRYTGYLCFCFPAY